jgi:hypothetical protein
MYFIAILLVSAPVWRLHNIVDSGGLSSTSARHRMNPKDVCAGAAPVGELDVDEVEAHRTASGSCDEGFADQGRQPLEWHSQGAR